MNSPSSFRICPCRPLVLALLLSILGVPAVRADELMRQVQEELRKRNLYFGDVNGLPSPQVAAALRRYQQRKGFEPTGEADNTTLRSLSLTTLAVTAAVAGAASPPASPPPALPVEPSRSLPPDDENPALPDLPVLRSDLGRDEPEPTAPEPVDIDPTPTPALKPPPAATFDRTPLESEVRKFVADFLQRGESNDPEAQLDLMADRVDYFNEGKVNKAFITRDTSHYNKRWPVRHFTVVDPIRLSGTADDAPDKVVVNFRCCFHVKQSDREKDPKEAKGMVENTYILARTNEEKLRVVSIKEERIRRKP